MEHFSSKNQYDLAIAYRIYPGISKTPFIHSENKLTLAETGIKTLKNSLGLLFTKVYFILDNCPFEYEEMILKYFDKDHVEFIKLDGSGNLYTFGLQIDILLNQTCSENVFFAEDDYVYKPMLLHSAVKFLGENPGIDFVTPYDHLDSYILPIHTNHKYEIMVFGGLHWRTAASTCLTFLTQKKTLQKTENILRSYSKGTWDSSMWFALTKYNVFNFGSLMKYAFSNPFLFKTVILSWKKLWPQILLGRKYKLWQPIPSIATHMEQSTLAPNIDWTKVAVQDEHTQNG